MSRGRYNLLTPEERVVYHREHRARHERRHRPPRGSAFPPEQQEWQPTFQKWITSPVVREEP
jgi:hypothetical protein